MDSEVFAAIAVALLVPSLVLMPAFVTLHFVWVWRRRPFARPDDPWWIAVPQRIIDEPAVGKAAVVVLAVAIIAHFMPWCVYSVPNRAFGGWETGILNIYHGIPSAICTTAAALIVVFATLFGLSRWQNFVLRGTAMLFLFAALVLQITLACRDTFPVSGIGDGQRMLTPRWDERPKKL